MNNKIVFKTLDPFSNLEKVKEIWSSLLKKCPHSYFHTWAWTEIWLNSLPRDCNLKLIAGFKNQEPVIAFYLGSKPVIRHKFFKIHQIALNQTLNPEIDTATYIEYNSILIDLEITISFESLLELLPLKSWDEMRMIRCSPRYQSNLIFNSDLSKKYELNIEKSRSYYVNLEIIRQNNNDYLALLSQNRRKQIRRTIKEYETIGKVRVDVAGNVEEALAIFNELIELHHKRWTERGYSGSYSGEYSVSFHSTLITERFKYGEIQLIRIAAGEHIVGCQYNYIYDGKVYAISGGYNYLPGNFYLPGFMSDYLTILHNTNGDLDIYDFMGGEYKYKKSLSTDYNEIDTYIIRKKNLRFWIQNTILKIYRLFKRS